MRCQYCSSKEQSGDVCARCGAPLTEKEQVKEMWKSEPFFYNGYIVYMLRDLSRDMYECQFWLGMELIERLALSYQALRMNVAENEDPMSFFWELFLVAHGEKEVMQWKERNNKRPAMFEVRRIADPEELRVASLSIYDLAMEAKR